MLFEIVKTIIISICLMPIAMKVGLWANTINRKEIENRSSKLISRTGGLSIFFGATISLLINPNFYLNKNQYFSTPNIPLVILISSLIIFIVGFIDDLKGLSPLRRLIIQILIAYFVFSRGIRFEVETIEFILNLQLGYQIINFINLGITILWIVGLINAINWIDGLDGLASGFTIIALICLIKIGNLNGLDAGIFLIPIIGSCIGFIYFNFYPAKIYMGDAGSYFLGFNLSVWSIILTNSSLLTEPNPNQVSGIIVCFIIMFMPIFDMTSLIVKRTLSGASPFYPDNKHFHHKLIECGFSHRSAVIFYFFIFQWFSNLAYATSLRIIVTKYFIISSLALIIFSFLNFNKLKKLFKLF